MKKLMIYGASNPEAVQLINSINKRQSTFKIIGFIDDYKKDQSDNFMDYPILGGEESIEKHYNKDIYFFNNVLMPKDRKLVSDKLSKFEVRYVTLISPSIDTDFIEIGYDCIISEGAQLGANTIIGNHVVIRKNSLVNHDCILEDYVFVGPGAIICGGVKIEEGAFIGAGAVIKNDITIHSQSFVGMGAVVNRSIKKGDVVASMPAKSVKNLIIPE